MSGSSVISIPVVGEAWRRNTPTVLSRTSFLHNSPEMSDVQFIFKNNENNEITVFGHKFILAMASPVFKKMFLDQNPQFTITGESRVDMSHHSFTPEAFLTFTKFLYTDKINYEGLSMEVIVGVLHCADYYDVPYLKMDCAKQLEKMITLKNVIQVLDAALLFREKDLTGVPIMPVVTLDLAFKATRLIARNLKSVFESEEILSAKLETLVLLLSLDNLDIDECFILDLALKWADHECSRKDFEPTVENKRKVLGKAFFAIRFALLASERISDLVSSGFLTPKESTDIFLAVHRPVRGAPTTKAGSNFKRICPGVAFESKPRLFGRKLELREIEKMEAKWNESNKLEYWKSLAKVQANLCMRGFVRGESEEGLKNYISRVGLFDIQVHRPRGIRGPFHVRFLYNPCVIAEANLFDPAYYELGDEIVISNWVEP